MLVYLLVQSLANIVHDIFNQKNISIMQKINIQQMEKLLGGRSEFIDGFCTGATIVSLYAPNPYSGSVTAACAVRELWYAYSS